MYTPERQLSIGCFLMAPIDGIYQNFIYSLSTYQPINLSTYKPINLFTYLPINLKPPLPTIPQNPYFCADYYYLTMRITLLISFILSLFWTAPPIQEYPCFFNDSKKWKLISYKNLVNQTETERPWQYNKLFEVIIQFDYDEQIEGGTFEGQSLSNLISGSYELLPDGLKINDFEHTAYREPAWGLDSLRIAMHSVTSFQCKGDTLLLNYNKGRHAMVFLKTETPFYDWDEYWQRIGGSSSID